MPCCEPVPALPLFTQRSVRHGFETQCSSRELALAGEEGIVHACSELQATVVITSDNLLEKLVRISKKVATIKTVIYAESEKKLLDEDLLNAQGNLNLIALKDLQTANYSNIALNLHSISGDDTALIMYTSGSTGIPKGVVVSQANLVACMRGADTVTSQLDLSENSKYVAYLPLAHILEFCFEHLYLSRGESTRWWSDGGRFVSRYKCSSRRRRHFLCDPGISAQRCAICQTGSHGGRAAGAGKNQAWRRQPVASQVSARQRAVQMEFELQTAVDQQRIQNSIARQTAVQER